MPPPASDLQLRPALPEEAEAVGALTVAGYDADGYLLYPDGSYDQGFAGWLADAASRAQKSTLLVAIEDDELLGTVTWCPYGSADAQLAKEPHQGEFRTLSIAPEARGRGIGRALVEHCLELARAADLTEVLLFSLDDMVPAHRLYTRLGFVRRPDLDWTPEPDVNLWAFSLTL